jgi:hypothetical protein
MPLEKGTISMSSSSHSPDRILVTFDDDHAVANAGLIQPATLADHLGLRQLFDECVHLGAGPGHANVGLKAMTLIYSALAGGDCIEDADRMRVAATTAWPWEEQCSLGRLIAVVTDDENFEPFIGLPDSRGDGTLGDQRPAVVSGDPDSDERFGFVCCGPADVVIPTCLDQQPTLVVSSDPAPNKLIEVLSRSLSELGQPVE